MESRDDRLKSIRRLGMLLAALCLLTLLISAYLRLRAAGLGCASWPDCYGQLLAGAAPPHSFLMRLAHRGAASLALLAGILLAWRCLRPHPIQPLARHAIGLVATMLLLTLVGIFSADPQRAWASFINMLGGIALVAMAWRLVLVAAEAGRPGPLRRALLPHMGLALLGLTIALGALIGARFATLSCNTVPACGGVWWPPAEGWHALNPLVTVTVPAVPGDPGGIALHLSHRTAAFAALLLLGLAGLRALARAGTRRSGAMLLALLAVEFALGSLTVTSGFSLRLAIGHSLGAAVLLAVAVQLLLRSRVASADF